MQWPPTDPKLAREASTLLTDLELAYRVCDSSPSAGLNFMNMMGRLISIGLRDLPEESRDFDQELLKLADALPPSCCARAIVNHLWRHITESPDVQVRGMAHLHWMARWHSLGCPAVTLESNLMASLMVTEATDDILATVKPPWDCFVVRLPQDIIELGQLKFTRVVVHRYSRRFNLNAWPIDIPENLREPSETLLQFMHRKEGQVWALFAMSDNDGRLLRTDRLGVLLGKERPEYLFDEGPDCGETAEDRLVCALSRLVVGISYLAENQPKALRPKSTKKQQHRWRFSKLPLTTEYVLAPDVPVKFDCTEAVGAFLRGERKGPPRFQWIVRGHWRNQVHGPGRTGRKRIWIQPYWKGPEHAPMRMREYRFEGKKEGE